MNKKKEKINKKSILRQVTHDEFLVALKLWDTDKSVRDLYKDNESYYFYIKHNDKYYSSKPIFCLAYNMHYNTTTTPANFYGGNSGIVPILIEKQIEVIDIRKDELNDEKVLELNVEGMKQLINTSRYERNSLNRRAAVEIHGTTCMACGFDFEKTYGEHGKDFIEVHHVNPLYLNDKEQIVNPETDLVCLCANCHRMVHRNRAKILTIDELKNLLHNAI